GKYYVPLKTDAALKWSVKDPFHVNFISEALWQFNEKTKKSKKIAFDKSVSNLNKRNYDDIETNIPLSNKRTKSTTLPIPPLGLIWDGDNWSCAYDSILVILYKLWQDNPEQWSMFFENMNEHLNILSHGFLGVLNKLVSFEDIRDHWRTVLHQQNAVY